MNAALTLTNAGYDSDIYYGYLDNAVPDITFLAAVPLQVLLPISKKIVLEVFDSPQYLFYFNTNSERALNNIFNGQAHFVFDKLYIQAGGRMSNFRQRLSPELNVNVRQKEEGLNGTILWQASQATSFAILYNTDRYEYGDATFEGIRLAETLNRKEDFADFVTYIQPSSRIRLSLDGQYGTYRFTESASGSEGMRSYAVLGGLEFVPREETSSPIEPPRGGLSLGFKRFDNIDPALPDDSGFVGAVDVSTGLFRRTTARAFLSRDFTFSAYSSGAYLLATTYGGGIGRILSRRAALAYDFSVSIGKYPEVEEGGIPAGQNYRYTGHAVNLNLRLSRLLAITFHGIISKRNVAGSGVATNHLFLGFSLVYGQAAGAISAPIRGLTR